jgi:DNA invertase Pin-like site-specific DNA recombinase
MRIGIYNRKQDLKFPTIEWLMLNNFDSFDIYDDEPLTEFEDLSEREGFNMMLYDASNNHLDAIYVHDLKVFSSLTVKVLQALIEIQKVNLPLYYCQGCIYPSDEAIRGFQNQMLDRWQKIKKQANKLELPDID